MTDLVQSLAFLAAVVFLTLTVTTHTRWLKQVSRRQHELQVMLMRLHDRVDAIDGRRDRP